MQEKVPTRTRIYQYAHSVRIEPTTLILESTRITYQATGNAGAEKLLGCATLPSSYQTKLTRHEATAETGATTATAAVLYPAGILHC